MGDSKNRQWVRIISDPRLANKFASESLYMDGHDLSYKDKLRVYDAYVGTLCLVLDCSHEIDTIKCLDRSAGYSRDFSTKNLTRMLIAWSKIDVIEFVTQMKSMLLAIRHLSSKKGCRNYSSFDEWLRAYDVRRDSVVVSPFVRLLKSVWSDLDIGIFECLNSIVQYASRLTLTDVDWVVEEEIQKYFTDEESFRLNRYDPELISEMRATLLWWLRDFSFEGARGQHGYGATAGVKRSLGTAAKYKDFLPTRETAILCSWLNWWPQDNCWPGISEAHDKLLYASEADASECWYHENVEQHMRYNLVPKAFNKKRGVSMEPTSHMFMQKMIFGLLDRYFDSHPQCHIHLHDQERSRALCLLGSKTGAYSTIDLSSASDSVTNTLVKALFQDTYLGEALQLCRTSYADVTLLDGTVKSIELEKFAPMGSAVCFPVECLVFSSVVAVARQRLGLHNAKYFVYGDDIVLDTRLYDCVCDLLTQLNFKVNLDKSYGGGSDFTEACGMEAYMGIDVSPIRIGRRWDITKLYPSSHARKSWDRSTILNAAYDAINDAYLRGYKNLRYLRLTQTLEKYPRAMFSHRTDMGICSAHEGPVATLYDSSRVKYVRAVQQVYVKCTCVHAETALGPDLERWSKLAEEYDSTTRSQLLSPEDRIEVKCGAAHVSTKDMWFPLQDLEAI